MEAVVTHVGVRKDAMRATLPALLISDRHRHIRRRADNRGAVVLLKPLDLAQLSETIRTPTGFGAQ